MVLAALTPASASAQRMIDSAPPEIFAMSLPRGELKGVVTGPRAARFLDTVRTRRTGTKADVWMLTIFEPAFKAGDGLARYNVERASIDCAAQRLTPRGANAYDAAGRSVIWLPAEPPEAITPESNFYHASQVVCSDVPLAGMPVVTGYAAAGALATKLIADAAR
jgi:hypothetical protein